MRSSALDAPFVFALLAACKATSNPLAVPADAECEVAETPLSEASWSGPSEQDVLASVATFAPTVVAWDGSTLSTESSSLSLVPTRTGDAAQIVERSRGGSATEESDSACRPGPELVLAVRFAVEIDGGSATGEIPGTLASTADGSVTYADALGPVELDATWEDLASTSFEERNPGATASEWRFTMSFQEWGSGAAVGIEGVGDGSAPDVGESTSALWSGHLSAGE